MIILIAFVALARVIALVHRPELCQNQLKLHCLSNMRTFTLVAVLLLARLKPTVDGYGMDDMWKITLILDKEAGDLMGKSEPERLSTLRKYFAAHPSYVSRKLRINLQVIDVLFDPFAGKQTPEVLDLLEQHTRNTFGKEDPIWKTMVLILTGNWLPRGWLYEDLLRDVDPGIYVSFPSEPEPIAVVSMKRNPNTTRERHETTRAIAQAMLVTIGIRLTVQWCDRTKNCCTCSGKPCIMDYDNSNSDKLPECSIPRLLHRKWDFIGKGDHSIDPKVAICGNGVREETHFWTPHGKQKIDMEQCDCYVTDHECKKCCDDKNCTIIQTDENCVPTTTTPLATEPVKDPDDNDPDNHKDVNKESTTSGSNNIKPESGKSNGLLIVWILVGVVVVLMLIATVVIGSILHKKKKKKKKFKLEASLSKHVWTRKSSRSSDKLKSPRAMDNKPHEGPADSATHFFS
jgi:hypothetical protein